MEITKDTRVSDILQEYGDIADVMELLGIKRVARYSFRRMLTKALTVEMAARVHRVTLDEFLATLRAAVEKASAQEEASAQRHVSPVGSIWSGCQGRPGRRYGEPAPIITGSGGRSPCLKAISQARCNP